jgi:hypothetical protein
MSELDELERDLEEAAAIWFSPALHAKVKRVIAIAREGERQKAADFREAVAVKIGAEMRFDAEHDLGV